MKPGHIFTAGRPREMLAWGQALIDSDQMGVPTCCNAVTEIAPRCLAAFLKNTLYTLWQRRKIYEFLMRGALNPLSELDEISDAKINRYQRRRLVSKSSVKINCLRLRSNQNTEMYQLFKAMAATGVSGRPTLTHTWGWLGSVDVVQ